MWNRRVIAAVIALLGGVGVVVTQATQRDLPEEVKRYTERVLCDVPAGQCADLMRRTVRDLPDGGEATRGHCDAFDESTLKWSEKLWCLEATNAQRGAIRSWTAVYNTMALADGGPRDGGFAPGGGPALDGGFYSVEQDPDGCWVHLQFTPAMVKLIGDRLTVGASDSCLTCQDLSCLPAKVKTRDGTSIAHKFGSRSVFDPAPDAGPDGSAP